MTDRLLDDGPFERVLRATLADLAPETAPETLRAAVATVPARPVRRGVPGRALIAGVALAAAVIVAVAGGFVERPLGPLRGTPPPVGSPSPASPTPGMEAFTFRVVTTDGSTASKAQVQAVSDVMAARLRAYGIGTFSSSASDDRITFELVVPADAGSSDTVRDLLGTKGAFSIGRPAVEALEPGDPVTGTPLLTGDSISDALVGNDENGMPTLILKTEGAAAQALADATRTHIGEYLPVALDGAAIVVPVIQSEIADGSLQISFASDDTTTGPRLAAILLSGPLPLPVEAVAP